MDQVLSGKGKIRHMFNNCPKPNGWFGCFFELEDGQSIKLLGTYHGMLSENMTYSVYAKQVDADTYSVVTMYPEVTPDHSIVKYLSSKEFPGIGPTIAEKLWVAFGKDILNVIESDSASLKKLGLSDKKIQTLQVGVCKVSIESKLKRTCPNISESFAEKLILHYQDQTMDVVMNHPYDILYDMEDARFPDVDALAKAIGFPSNHPTRLSECLCYAIHVICEDTGDVYLNVSDDGIYNQIWYKFVQYVGDTSIPSSELSDVMNQMSNIKRLHMECCGTEYHVYENCKYLDEKTVGTILRKMIHQPPIFKESISMIDTYIDAYEKAHQYQLDDEQKYAVRTSLCNRLSIITGGPGRGKTTVVDCILWIWDQCMDGFPQLAAPTGRSVNRLQEATHERYETETIMHRICQMKFYKRMKNAKFSNVDSVLDRYKQTLIVVDEVSMVGLHTASEMMQLFQDGQVILVGDIDQLSSIEYGQFFRDVCENSLIPKSRLLTNHRASGAGVIIDNADKINDGDLVANLNLSTRSFMFDKFQTNDDYSFHLMNNYMRYVCDRKGELDIKKLKTVCLLSPMRRGNGGVKQLNAMIQKRLNPIEPNATSDMRGYEIQSTYYSLEYGEFTRFHVGDRVVQTKNRNDSFCYRMKNGFRTNCSNTSIANGDVGIILGYEEPDSNDDEGTIVVKMDDGRIFEIEDKYANELELAYAMTIHKSQGSEYDTVLLSMPSALTYTQGDFASRNLFYTAVTRAKQCVHIIGDELAVNKCIQTKQFVRHSNLNAYIK